MCLNENISFNFQQFSYFLSDNPGHVKMLEDRTGKNEIKLLIIKIRRKLMGVSHHIDVFTFVKVKSNVVSLRERFS